MYQTREIDSCKKLNFEGGCACRLAPALLPKARVAVVEPAVAVVVEARETSDQGSAGASGASNTRGATNAGQTPCDISGGATCGPRDQVTPRVEYQRRYRTSRGPCLLPREAASAR
jgi:hypothetical protein